MKKVNGYNYDDLTIMCLYTLQQSEEPMTAEEISYKLDYSENFTVIGIRARLYQLIKNGEVSKDARREFGKYKIVYYCNI